MQPIVCVGDVHEGIGFGIRIDPDTGISERALDLHRDFTAVAEQAFESATGRRKQRRDVRRNPTKTRSVREASLEPIRNH